MAWGAFPARLGQNSWSSLPGSWTWAPDSGSTLPEPAWKRPVLRIENRATIVQNGIEELRGGGGGQRPLGVVPTIVLSAWNDRIFAVGDTSQQTKDRHGPPGDGRLHLHHSPYRSSAGVSTANDQKMVGGGTRGVAISVLGNVGQRVNIQAETYDQIIMHGSN